MFYFTIYGLHNCKIDKQQSAVVFIVNENEKQRFTFTGIQTFIPGFSQKIFKLTLEA